MFDMDFDVSSKIRWIILLICAIFGGTMIGCFHYCENKHSSIVGQDGIRYWSYREACDNHDYEAAHKFITLMSKELGGSWDPDKWSQSDIDEATAYVFQHEVSYLLAEMGEDANTRVLLLIKELPNQVYSDDYCDFVLDIAIMTRNKTLAEDVISLYKGDDQQDEAKEKLQEAIESGKFED